MKERFEGDNRPNLIDALKRQEFLLAKLPSQKRWRSRASYLSFRRGTK